MGMPSECAKDIRRGLDGAQDAPAIGVISHTCHFAAPDRTQTIFERRPIEGNMMKYDDWTSVFELAYEPFCLFRIKKSRPSFAHLHIGRIERNESNALQ